MGVRRRDTQADTCRLGRVVELCGLPGAGKTTLARALVQELAGRGHRVRAGALSIAPDVPAQRRILLKAAFAMREALAHPMCTAAAVDAIARSEQRRIDDVPARALQWTVTQWLLRAARRTPGLHVFDEGVIQALWSLALRGNPGRMLHTLEASRGWVRPDLVVVVEAPLDVVRDRLVSRRSNHARSQALDPTRQWLELERGERQLDGLVSWWRGVHGPHSVTRVRDDGDLAGVATRIGEISSPGRIS
jgi:chloramphenicol 3-O-phosphotransferase